VAFCLFVRSSLPRFLRSFLHTVSNNSWPSSCGALGQPRIQKREQFFGWKLLVCPWINTIVVQITLICFPDKPGGPPTRSGNFVRLRGWI
jgi:hypothetical protein